jgi:hypothetical protein
VTDWRRIVVGGAFKLNSRNPRYYTDLVLMWPTIVFGWGFLRAVWTWPPTSWDLRQVVLRGGLLALSIFLTKERVAILIGCLGFTIVQVVWGMYFHPEHSAAALATIGGCLAAAFVLYWPNRFRTQVYGSDRPVRGSDMLGLLCCIAGFCLALLATSWVGR